MAKYTRAFVKEQLEIYVSIALDIYDERIRSNPEYQINYPTLMIAAIEEQCGPEGQSLGWICDNCGEANCKDCFPNEEDEDDETEED